ncbi:hypothetical protein K493DRAFT_79101 [Basidiobolus meristosporus CBS 931.73]|uniref:Uncharacterized protein n=1 Tax=Basidiobolus meristosporus CBS 931.73 TaxID=1314790 RepID=A0A1Y1XRG7_9FUNG|nr:hypothetical protein K493DRAFT_79101 [Basidiobolus meristosporus CBS 931.73]|eukprot:ORX88348.1 hypothetical protein K493DRAFT_79101 [Basidiobolus meristosporus CBS 931.73]
MDVEEEDERVQTLLSDRSECKRRHKSDAQNPETKTTPLTNLLSHLTTRGPPRRRGIPIAIPSNPPPTPIAATPVKKRKVATEKEPISSGSTLKRLDSSLVDDPQDSILVISDEERVQVSPLATKSKQTVHQMVHSQDNHNHESTKFEQPNEVAMQADNVQSPDEMDVAKMVTPTKKRISTLFEEAAAQTPSKLVAKKAYIIEVPSNRLSKSPVEKIMQVVEQPEPEIKAEPQVPTPTSPQTSPNQGTANGHLTLPLKFLKIGTLECDGREQVVEISYRSQTLSFLVDLKEVCSINILDIFKLEYYDQNQPELLLLKTTHALENPDLDDSYNPDSYIDKKTRILCFFDSHSQFARLRRSLVVCVRPECEIFIQKYSSLASSHTVPRLL